MATIREIETYVKENYRKLIVFALRFVPTMQDAEDMVSEATRKAIKGCHRLRNDDYLATWFHRIVIREAATYRKKIKHAVPLEQAGRMFTLMPEPEGGVVWVALAELPFYYREPLLIVYVGGYSYEEAASMCGVTKATIRSRVHTAKEKMRERLSVDAVF